MLGNDVVDLADPEAAEGALHPRFDARAFTASERARLDAAAERPALRWVLWAAKEAAWKAVRRLAPDCPFHPARIEARLAPAGRGAFAGEVAIAGARFRVRVEVAGEAVHAVAVHRALPAPRVRAAWRALRGGGAPPAPSAGSDEARGLAVELASHALAVPRHELTVARRARMPELLRAGAAVPVCLSLSHHGRFAAAALALPRGDAA